MQLAALEIEKAGLTETVSQKDVELAGLGAELERVQSSLASERESGVKAAETLQNQLNEKVKNRLHVKARVDLYIYMKPTCLGSFWIHEKRTLG